MEKNRADKKRLEQCVSNLGFVRSARILPSGGGNIVEIEVKNVATIEITGLVLQVLSRKLEELGLNDKTVIRVEKLEPNSTTFYREYVSGFRDDFPDVEALDLVVWDVLNVEGVEIIEHIMWSRWPLVSSIEEFNLAESEFCRTT